MGLSESMRRFLQLLSISSQIKKRKANRAGEQGSPGGGLSPAGAWRYQKIAEADWKEWALRNQIERQRLWPLLPTNGHRRESSSVRTRNNCIGASSIVSPIWQVGQREFRLLWAYKFFTHPPLARFKVLVARAIPISVPLWHPVGFSHRSKHFL